MIRILHLRSSCGLYGADRALLDLAEATRLPLEPIVGSIVRGSEDALGDEAARRRLLHWRIQSDGRADLAAARDLAKRLSDENVWLIHAHDYKSLALATLAGRKAGVPVVATYHGDTSATPALVAYEALARTLGNLTRGVAAVSAPLGHKLRRWVKAAKVHHIPNGIRTPAPLTDDEQAQARAKFGIAPEAQVLAVVGRLSKEKGHAVLLDACRRMSARPVVLAAGTGALEAELKAQAEGLDVRWLGFVQDARPVYAAADAVVMPSLTEGLPLVALEAMALGVPLVASAVGELPTLLSGGAGVLVPAADPKMLASSLDRVLADGAWRAELSARAQQRVRAEYALDTMAERYARLLYAPALVERTGTRGAYALAAEGVR